MRDYKIIDSTEPANVEREVRKLIARGWEPLGNLLLATKPGSAAKPVSEDRQITYVQAMVLHGPPASITRRRPR